MTWQRGVRDALTEISDRWLEAVNAHGPGDGPLPRPEVAEDFVAVHFAPWYPNGAWRGDRAAWMARSARDAGLRGDARPSWTRTGLLVLPRGPDRGVVATSLVVGTGDDDPLRAGALSLESWVREGGVWRLERHRAELARLPADEPAWSLRARAGTSALIRRWVEEQTTIWDTGRIEQGMVTARYTESLFAEQYAEWHPGGVWRGDGAAWVAGTLEQAQPAVGRGWRWRLEGMLVLPRRDDEVSVVYQIGLAHGLDADAPRSRGLLLETWVRREGGWALHRHLGELAWS